MAAARASAGTEGDAVGRRVWQLPRSTTAMSRTRRELNALLEHRGVCEDACDAILLVAHELVVNGLEHGRTDVRLIVDIGPRSVRIDVHDDSPEPPQLQPMEPTAVRGRGLQMVDGLALDWGWHRTGAGKIVWAEVPVDGHPGPAA